MPQEEPIPPLDAILDGSGVRYYSKRTRQLTSLEKKLEAARDAFNTARKENGLSDPPKLFHRSGSSPARVTVVTATSPVSSAALRRELHHQALQASGHGGGVFSTAAGTSDPTAAASSGGGVGSGSSGGGAAAAPTSRSRSARDSDFQRFADSLVGSGRGPVVVAKPYHTDARTYFSLSLLPTSVKGLAADSGLYYSPVATMRGVPGPAAKSLREDCKFRYFHSELAMEREEKEQAVQLEMSRRLAKAQESLGMHIQSLVARWGPGFLERLMAAAAAEASGEAGRSSRVSGVSITSLSAAGGGASGTSGGGAGGRQSPLKLHLSAGGMAVPASSADAVYEFEHYRKKGSGWPRRSSSPPPIGSTAGRLYGISDMRVSASTMERLSYLSNQLKVPVEQIMTLLRKSGSAGDGRSSPTSTVTKRSGGGVSSGGGSGGGGNVVVGMAGARQSRRIELQPTRRPTSLTKRESHAAAGAAMSGDEQSGVLDAQVAAIMADTAAAMVAEAGQVSAPAEAAIRSPFADGVAAAQVQSQGSPRSRESKGPGATAAGLGEAIAASAAATAAAAAATGGSRYESQKGKHRHIHLVVAAAVAERDEAEARAAAAKAYGRRQLSQKPQHQHQLKQQLSKQQQQQRQLDGVLATISSVSQPNVSSIDAAAATIATVASGGRFDAPQFPTVEVPKTPVDLERPSLIMAASTQSPSGDAGGAGAQEAGGVTDDLVSPTRRFGSRMNLASPTIHQVWSAFPSRRGKSHTSTSPPGSPSASTGPSPIIPRPIAENIDADNGSDGRIMVSSLDSPVAYHHPSGLSYVTLGQAMPAGPSLEGLQPVDPRQGELEAASRAALESLARRHGDSYRSSRYHHQNGGGSRAGSASTASRPGTSGGVGERGGGGGASQSQRRNRSRPNSRLSGTGASSRSGGGGGGEQRRPTVGGMNNGKADDGGWDGSIGGGALRFSERGSGEVDDGVEGGRAGLNESGGRHRSGPVRSARSGVSGVGGVSARRRARGSPIPTYFHSSSVAGLTGAFGSGAPGSSGEEVIFATGGGVGSATKPSGTGSPTGDTGDVGGTGIVRKGLRRLSDLAVSVGLHVGTNRSRQTSSPRSSTSAGAGAAGVLDTSDEDTLDGGEAREIDEGQEDADAAAALARLVSRPTSPTATPSNGMLQLSWGNLCGTAAAVAVPPPPAQAVAARGDAGAAAARISTSQVSKPTTRQPLAALTASSSSGTPSTAPVLAMAATAAAASQGSDSKLLGTVGSKAGCPGQPDISLNTPSLSRHYKLAGSRWNPTAPGALRPGYGTESDYVAGTYNPDLMERVMAARDTAALTGEEVPVDYKSPVQAVSTRSSVVMAPSPAVTAPVPLTQRQSVSVTSTAGSTQAMPPTPATSVRISLDLSVLTPAGRAAAANAKAAVAIADVLNPVTRALTNTTVLATANGSALPAPLQALAQTRGTLPTGPITGSITGRTTIQLPAAAIAAANSLAHQLVEVPRSSRVSPDMPLRRAGGGSSCVTASTGGSSVNCLSAAAAEPPEERVVSRTIRPSQSVWGRAELDEHDILQPLNQHLAATTWAAAATSAAGPSGPRPTAAGAVALASASGLSATTTAERRAVTAPGGLLPASGAHTPTPTPRPPIPEPRLWRGNPLDLKAAFPKGEKVYRLVTDVQANARLLREVEKDITPVEFRNRLRRGVVL